MTNGDFQALLAAKDSAYLVVVQPDLNKQEYFAPQGEVEAVELGGTGGPVAVVIKLSSQDPSLGTYYSK